MKLVVPIITSGCPLTPTTKSALASIFAGYGLEVDFIHSSSEGLFRITSESSVIIPYIVCCDREPSGQALDIALWIRKKRPRAFIIGLDDNRILNAVSSHSHILGLFQVEWPLELREALNYIISHLGSTHLSVSEVCHALYRSHDTFNRLFQRWLHCTPGETLIFLRMMAAEELLISTSLSIGEIAFATGYDHSAFSRRFSSFHGISPLQYRELALYSHGIQAGNAPRTDKGNTQLKNDLKVQLGVLSIRDKLFWEARHS